MNFAIIGDHPFKPTFSMRVRLTEDGNPVVSAGEHSRRVGTCTGIVGVGHALDFADKTARPAFREMIDTLRWEDLL